MKKKSSGEIKPRVIILFGPTGVGKTALLESLSGKPFEIISADALQVYRGLNIGTAKPSGKTLLAVPHHIIDIREPHEPFTVGEFITEAEQAVMDITARNCVPVISGGTGFYIKHFLFGLPEAPKSDPSIRLEIEKLYEGKGLAYCRELLREADPISEARIGRNDAYRVLRALEVLKSSGRPLSSFAMTGRMRQDIDPLVIGLTRDREELYERINARVDTMFRMGLADEVKNLVSNGAKADWPAMKGIGYREFFLAAQSGEFGFSGIADLIKKNSRAYAKRQMTFFRALPSVKWMHPARDAKELTQLLLQQFS